MTARLPYGLAVACETATGPVCKCRCGGALHGADRGRPYDLDEGDPHFVHEEYAQYQSDMFEAQSEGEHGEMSLNRTARAVADGRAAGEARGR